MDFCEALAALRRGNSVKRKSWDGTGVTLAMPPASGTIWQRDADGATEIWCPTQGEILADDWVTVYD